MSLAKAQRSARALLREVRGDLAQAYTGEHDLENGTLANAYLIVGSIACQRDASVSPAHAFMAAVIETGIRNGARSKEAILVEITFALDEMWDARAKLLESGGEMFV